MTGEAARAALTFYSLSSKVAAARGEAASPAIDEGGISMDRDSSNDARSDLNDAVRAVMGRRISRRQFVQRATVLGLSAGAIGSILAACGGGGGGAETTAPDTGAAAGATEAATSAPAEKPYEGKTVRALIVAEGDDKAVQDKIPEIKEQLGINVEMTALAAGPLNEKAAQSLNAAEGSFDLINVLGFTVSQFVGGDNYELLQPYLDDPAKTPADYDLSDFLEGQLEYVGYYDIAKQQFGGDSLYLIPGLHGGSVIMYYRQDLLDAAGLAPPATWDEYVAAAEALNRDGVAGNSMVAKSGDVSMFLVDWFTRFATTGGVLMNGSPGDKTFEPNLTSPEAVAALQNMVDLVQFASDGVLSYDFTISVDAFSTGKTALMLMWSTIAGPIYNPDTSKVADKVGVAVNPGDGANAGKAVRGGWGVGIPKNAKEKDAAWAVLTYLTSKSFEKYATGTYFIDPSRKSTFADPELVAAQPYLPVAGEVAASAEILPIALVPEAFELMTAAAEEFSAALNGSSSAAEACGKAQDRWVEVLRRGGWLA